MINGDRDESRNKSRSRYKNVECHCCHKTRHIQRNCFLWKKESKDKNVGSSGLEIIKNGGLN